MAVYEKITKHTKVFVDADNNIYNSYEDLKAHKPSGHIRMAKPTSPNQGGEGEEKEVKE